MSFDIGTLALAALLGVIAVIGSAAVRPLPRRCSTCDLLRDTNGSLHQALADEQERRTTDLAIAEQRLNNALDARDDIARTGATPEGVQQ